MREVDPGHEYLLDSYDGGEPVRLTFVKREGEDYPFNVGHHPGTNCQEVIRALIARVKYLQRQIPCEENERVISDLRSCLWAFESRAAQRHGRASVFRWQEKYQSIPVEDQPTCAGCGHIGCDGNGHRTHGIAAATPATATSTEQCAGKILERINAALVATVPNEVKVAFGEDAGVQVGQGAIPKIAAIIRQYFPSAVPVDAHEPVGDGRYCRHYDDDPAHGAICYDNRLYEGAK